MPGRRRKRGHGGAGLLDLLKKAHRVIKDNRVISKVAGALHNAGVPYAGKVSTVASAAGYGRRRRRRRRRV